jgi:hypothetical protein
VAYRHQTYILIKSLLSTLFGYSLRVFVTKPSYSCITNYEKVKISKSEPKKFSILFTLKWTVRLEWYIGQAYIICHIEDGQKMIYFST